jgi:transcriptional regulator with XRE-family HTH domain
MDALGAKITEIDTLIGLKLKEHREEKGLSQAEMGKLIGSSQTRWAKLESAKTSLNIADMYELCGALEINTHEFFTEVHEFKKELEAEGWEVKTALEDGEVDLLRSFSSMTSTALGAFGLGSTVSAAGVAGAAGAAGIVGAFLGSAVSSYLSKKK